MMFLFQIKKLVYVYLVRYAEEQQDLALLSIATFQRGLKVIFVFVNYHHHFYYYFLVPCLCREQNFQTPITFQRICTEFRMICCCNSTNLISIPNFFNHGIEVVDIVTQTLITPEFIFGRITLIISTFLMIPFILWSYYGPLNFSLQICSFSCPTLCLSSILIEANTFG